MTTELPASTTARLASTGSSSGDRWPYFVVPLFLFLMGLLFASQLRFIQDLSWADALSRAMAEWAPWVLLSPAIFWVATRFPLRPGQFARALLVSVAVCATSIWTAEKIFQAFDPGRIMDEPAAERGPAAEFGRPPGEGEFMPPPGAKKKRKGPGRMGGGPAGGPAANGAGPMQHIMHFHVPIGLFIIMASHAFAYFRDLRERERKASELARSLAEARLSALQMQVHPHFLFNSLNAIAALVHKNPQAAEDTITNLSELLRVALSTRNQHEISLARELSYLESYLAIERIRFGERLQIEWAIDEEARMAQVPVLLLQPLVENAIRHGIEHRSENVGRVKIAASVKDGRLVLSVRDNGPGPNATSSGRRGHGVGLENTRARLATLHGANADVQLEAAEGGGCLATVTCPFFIQPQKLT